MGKKSIVIWGWIFGILLFGTVVSAIVFQFMGNKELLLISLILVLLVVLESVCIICLTSLNTDENAKYMKKIELLERASFSKNENAEKLAKNEKTEIYKIFCNTLVDL